MQLAKVVEDNKQLRLQIGQEQFKAQQLGKLRTQAQMCQQREMEARRGEARAMKELEEARSYVDRRNTSSTNEKTELLQSINKLENEAEEAGDREAALHVEFEDALFNQGSVEDRVEEISRERDRWHSDALAQSAKLRDLDHRVRELEQKRTESKAKIKALSNQLKVAVAPPAADGDVPPPRSLRQAPTEVDASQPRSTSSPSKELQQQSSRKARSAAASVSVADDALDELALLHGRSWFSCSRRGQSGPVRPRKRPSSRTSSTFLERAMGMFRWGRSAKFGSQAGRKGRRSADSTARATTVAQGPSSAVDAEHEDAGGEQRMLAALVALVVGLAAMKLCSQG